MDKRPLPDFGSDPKATFNDRRNGRAAHLAALRHLYPIPGPIPDKVTETDHKISVRDGASITVRIYTPTAASPSEGRPLIVMFHEGGWYQGDPTDEALNCRLFARDLNAVCVNVDYRLAPEHPFPTGIDDAWDALRWCAATAAPTSTLLPADPARAGFLVGGASAGGNFAAVVSQIARDEKLQPPLTGQYLCVPALLNVEEHDVPAAWKADCRSRYVLGNDPVIPVKPGQVSPSYHLLKAPPLDPRFSPMLHKNLKDLPPAFFQIGGLDPLRDEAILYERLLRADNGVATKIKVYDGFGHM